MIDGDNMYKYFAWAANFDSLRNKYRHLKHSAIGNMF
jgi:hypothetical protein